MNKEWDIEDLIYAAAFLDGEGCFSIGQHYKITVSASNSDRSVIEWFKETFGGSICLNATRRRRPNHSKMNSWCIVSREAENFCMAVLPFLKVKAEQCAGLLAMRQTFTPGKAKRLVPEVVAERNRIARRIKELKHVVQ